MKKFNLRIFVIAAFGTLILTASLWTLIWAHEEKNMAIINGVWKLIITLSSILRFPIYKLFWNFLISNNNQIYFIIGWLIDCAFWGVIFERIFSLFHKKREIQHTSAIQ
jgi:hypothetical protein